MKTCATCRQELPREAFYPRRGSCKACHCARTNRQAAERREANPDAAREKARTRYAKRADAYRSTRRDYTARNKERVRQWDREAKLRSIGQVYARNEERVRAVKRATPPWADRSAIASVYREARRLTAETGIRYSVDHIHPLKGARSCGLHVPWNLRAIPLAENARKGNRLES